MCSWPWVNIPDDPLTVACKYAKVGFPAASPQIPAFVARTLHGLLVSAWMNSLSAR